MAEKPSNSNYDLTQAGSDRGDQKSTEIAREQESDDVNENTNLGKISSEKGDGAAENKVATSLDDE